MEKWDGALDRLFWNIFGPIAKGLWWLFLAVLAVVGIVVARSISDDIPWPTVLTVVVFLNVMATITLWREAARRPEKPKDKFFAALLDSKPVTPRHQPPKAISELASDADRRFFEDFKDFAHIANMWLADVSECPWRLQELPDTDLRLSISDYGPDFGRRYSIFHNQICLGTLEVSAGSKYTANTSVVRTEIRLDDWVRLLSYESIAGFLSDIALYVCAVEDAKEGRKSNTTIDRALSRVLWQTLQITKYPMDGEDHGYLELQFNGSAAWYLERRQQVRAMT
jgi:hypothetical protein